METKAASTTEDTSRRAQTARIQFLYKGGADPVDIWQRLSDNKRTGKTVFLHDNARSRVMCATHRTTTFPLGDTYQSHSLDRTS